VNDKATSNPPDFQVLFNPSGALPPYPLRKPTEGDPRYTIDTFIAEVPLDPNRAILVYMREHGGRRYIRWRVFHRHRKGRNWYPDKRRAFVVPVEGAASLGDAIAKATCGQPITPKPAWLASVDYFRQRRGYCLLELNAPPAVLEAEMRKRLRGPV
jgi:hypothetical protein